MPVLAGALTCLLSNALYILSYQTRSLWLLVLSRFVLGFGMSLSPCKHLKHNLSHLRLELGSLHTQKLILWMSRGATCTCVTHAELTNK